LQRLFFSFSAFLGRQRSRDVREGILGFLRQFRQLSRKMRDGRIKLDSAYFVKPR
jgi:hypothetical protein